MLTCAHLPRCETHTLKQRRAVHHRVPGAGYASDRQTRTNLPLTSFFYSLPSNHQTYLFLALKFLVIVIPSCFCLKSLIFLCPLTSSPALNPLSVPQITRGYSSCQHVVMRSHGFSNYKEEFYHPHLLGVVTVAKNRFWIFLFGV